MTLRRFAAPPSVSCLPRSSLDANHRQDIDGVLKQLKACTRQLQKALASHRLELQVLERLFYKSKNQHRAALFWRRLVEVRRLGDRLVNMDILCIVERLRASFWGEAYPPDPKVMRGSWSHYPNHDIVLFTLRRMSDCSVLLEKSSERLAQAYRMFTIEMQSGAFIQLILVLAAIVSRLNDLLTEVDENVQSCRDACAKLLRLLSPELAEKYRILLPRQTKTTAPEVMGVVHPGVPQKQRNLVPNEGLNEDVGDVLQRPSTSQNAVDNASEYPAIQDLEDMLPEVLPASFIDPAAMMTTVVNERTAAHSQLAGPVVEKTGHKRVRNREVEKQEARNTKVRKRKKDEIDDIFGF